MQNFTKYFLFSCGFVVFFLSACSLVPTSENTDSNTKIDYLTGASNMSSGASLEAQTHQATIDDSEKVRLAIARQKQISTIRKGDYMITKNQPKEALSYYLAALQKIPDDIVLLRKIGHSYFLLKNWSEAYEYLIRVPLSELSVEMQDELFKSLFYADRDDTKSELQKLEVSLPAPSVYYSTIFPCFSGLAPCTDSINSYTGNNKKLGILQDVLEDVSYVSPTDSYRGFRLAVALYEQQMYRLSYLFSKNLLENNPDYMEAKKLQGFALYELGRYEASQEILLLYLENNADDLEVIIRLGEISAYREEYEKAILYLNNAIIAGYTPKTLLERRLAYNYAKLEDVTSMQKVLGYLLQEEDATEDDYAVAISLAISKKQYSKAYAWSYEGLKRFNGSKILVPLYLQATRLSQRSGDAKRYLETLPDTVRALPLVRLEEAILLYNADDFQNSKKIFSWLVDFDAQSDFGLESQEYLDRISVEEIAAAYKASNSGQVEMPEKYEFDPDFWN